MHLTPEEQRVGRENFETAVGVSRRDVLRAAIGAGASLASGIGPHAFGYGGPQDMKSPVRIGLIGTGGQGGVLVGALQPEYHQVVAVCDIRPYNLHRVFHGDWSSSAAKRVRTGLLDKYGWKSETEAKRHVRVYERYEELLAFSDVEAVVIALPLHLHHEVAMAAIAAGKHIYLESLMARNVGQCKQIARVAARRQEVICAVGHQRHYNFFYQSAAELLEKKAVGQVHAIHAQWHRGNLPGLDSWQPPIPGGEVTADGRKEDKISRRLRSLQAMRDRPRPGQDNARIERLIAQWSAWQEDRHVDAAKFGYQEKVVAGRRRSPLEELCRWRLWERTASGIMNQLGHHQLDATLLLLDALQGQPARPLHVFATGGQSIFPHTRETEDRATCVMEFAGAPYDAKDVGFLDRVSNYPAEGIAGYDDDPQKRISLVYTTTNGNGTAGYGERVLGTDGSLELHRETEGLLFKGGRTTPLTATETDAVTSPTRLRLSYSRKQPPEAGLAQAISSDYPSRGFREALEHWAWCIRHPDPKNQPRCDPQRALRNAVLAQTCTLAIRGSEHGIGQLVEFRPEWFDIESDRTPEADILTS